MGAQYMKISERTLTFLLSIGIIMILSIPYI